MQPVLAGFFGGWELVLILATVLILACGALAVIGIIFMILRAQERKKRIAPPPILPITPDR